MTTSLKEFSNVLGKNIFVNDIVSQMSGVKALEGMPKELDRYFATFDDIHEIHAHLRGLLGTEEKDLEQSYIDMPSIVLTDIVELRMNALEAEKRKYGATKHLVDRYWNVKRLLTDLIELDKPEFAVESQMSIRQLANPYKDPRTGKRNVRSQQTEPKIQESKKKIIAEKEGQMTLFGRTKRQLGAWNSTQQNEYRRIFDDLYNRSEKAAEALRAKGYSWYDINKYVESLALSLTPDSFGHKQALHRGQEKFLTDLEKAEKPKSKEMTQYEKTKLQEQLERYDAMVKEAKKPKNKVTEKGEQMRLFGKLGFTKRDAAEAITHEYAEFMRRLQDTALDLIDKSPADRAKIERFKGDVKIISATNAPTYKQAREMIYPNLDYIFYEIIDELAPNFRTAENLRNRQSEIIYRQERYTPPETQHKTMPNEPSAYPTNANELIKAYNDLVDSIDKSKDSPSILRNFTDYQWIIFIAGKSLDYGRPFEKAIENAKLNLEKPKEKLIKLWAYKDPEANYIPVSIIPKEAKKAEKKIAEKGGQMTLFGDYGYHYKSYDDPVDVSYAKKIIQSALAKNVDKLEPSQIQSIITKLRDEEIRLINYGFKGKGIQGDFLYTNLNYAIEHLLKIYKPEKKTIPESKGQMTLFGKFKKLTPKEKLEHIAINATNRANKKFNHLVETAATRLRNEDINRRVGVDQAWDAYRNYYVKDLRQYVLDLLVEGTAHINIPSIAVARYKNTNPIEHVKESKTIIEMAMNDPQMLKPYLKEPEKRVSKPEPMEAKQERFKREIIKQLTVPVTRTEEEKLEINRSLTKSRGALIPLPNEPVQKKPEKMISEKGGQMTLFGKIEPYYFKDTGAKVFVSDTIKYHRGPAFKRQDRYRFEILDEEKEHMGTMSQRQIETQLTKTKPAKEMTLFGVRFKADVTANQIRSRVFDPKKIIDGTYFTRESTTPGVTYVMGQNEKNGKFVTQSIRFDRSIFDTGRAKRWFKANIKRIQERDAKTYPYPKPYYIKSELGSIPQKTRAEQLAFFGRALAGKIAMKG